MPTSTSTVGPRPAIAETANGNREGSSSFPDQFENSDCPSIPNRGIVLGLLTSGALWAAIILAAHELRQLFR
ncbi:MAG: hypothetical protein WA802_14735 [Terracidiphilus sp.]